jgi:molybdopterin converting factor small subunit
LEVRTREHGEALANREAIRVAVNQEYAQPGDPVKAGDEIALFPPVTGG